VFEARDTQRFERELAALLRKAVQADKDTPGGGDPEAFARVVALIDGARDRLPEVAEQLRANGGYSWADLARPLGVTPSAAYQRFGSGRAARRKAAAPA